MGRRSRILKNQNPLTIFLMFTIVTAAVFTILTAPYIFKDNYVWIMRLSFLLACFVGVIRKKQDFLVFLFVVSLSFSALNINVEKYFPELGYFVPWIAPSDILLFLMLIFELMKISAGKSKVLLPLEGNRAFLILIGSFLFSYIVIAPKYFIYQSSGIFLLLCVIRGYLVFMYFYNYLNTVVRYKVVLASFAFVVMMQFAFMVYQWLTGDVFTIIRFAYETLDDIRIEEYGVTRIAFGTFNFPSIAAGVMVIIFAISIAFTALQDANSKAISICRYLIMIFSPICVLLSGARVALVAMLLITPIIFLIMAMRYRLKTFRKLAIYFLLLIVFIGSIAMIASPLVQHWTKRFSYEDFVENSLRFRLLNYKIGMRALSDHPIVGVGWGNGDKYSSNYVKGSEEELYTVGLHNGYVGILVENGILGLIIYLFWYISLLKASFRKNKNYDQSSQFAFLAGIFTITVIQMILVDTNGIFLRNQTEYMHYCVCLGFLRGYDEIMRKNI